MVVQLSQTQLRENTIQFHQSLRYASARCMQQIGWGSTIIPTHNDLFKVECQRFQWISESAGALAILCTKTRFLNSRILNDSRHSVEWEHTLKKFLPMVIIPQIKTQLIIHENYKLKTTQHGLRNFVTELLDKFTVLEPSGGSVSRKD